MASERWDLLKTIREGYLGGTPGKTLADYWASDEHLAAYDATFAERIGWKWRAVLDELKAAGFAPPPRYVLHDFGTGTGIAARSVLNAFPDAAAVRLADRSARSVAFARERLGALRKDLEIIAWDASALTAEPAVLVISHVLTELDDAARSKLVALAKTAHTVLWVEPGTQAASRTLIAAREELRLTASVVAPCPHQGQCGMLSAENERHWCHMFAKPPPEASQSPFWAEFGKMMGIDLRSLPVSYVVTSRDPAAARVIEAGDARLIGRTREYKGFMKVFACDDAGVREATLQKRDDKARFKELGKGPFTARIPKGEAKPS